ncbi:MAG: phenylalanine--tRNA ligase beta subunit-related protein [Planctomycetota bacterium]
MPLNLTLDDHPDLRLGALTAAWPRPLGEAASHPWLTELLAGRGAPMSPSDEVRAAVRDLLRHGGYKPTGRGKPASEYLLKASSEGSLGSINLAVDVCNAVSLASGLPISVVDLDRARPPFRVGLAAAESRYVFNRSGQEIDVSGLLCFHDAEGPSANAVKDAQRTKTDESTTRVLCLVWGCLRLAERSEAATQWYQELLERTGATVERWK